VQPQICGFDRIRLSAINMRFSLNRDAALEKVNAISKPKRTNTAPSTAQVTPLPVDLFRPAPDREAAATFQHNQHAEEK